ncbi:hypothetical protein [Sphingobium lactosutens]|uniref:Uncharacterized protein n=1 Tax=Sphingobium lactosutens DS20 TaxID=1331060 RepID=T0IUT5_9SPHN|nr:hypothetical protein [Sphingobium lactosutens]EQB15615.1 hypothetical protein RLDS_10080 [Sphingobium lactosutens DS20]
MIEQPVTGYKTLRVFGWGFALIWAAFFVTLVFALADAPSLYGEPIVIATLVGMVMAVFGAYLTGLAKALGVYLYVAGAGIQVIKGFFLSQTWGFTWGYALFLVMFVAVVAPNWNLFRGRPNA